MSETINLIINPPDKSPESIIFAISGYVNNLGLDGYKIKGIDILEHLSDSIVIRFWMDDTKLEI